jgi:hypothetical protein
MTAALKNLEDSGPMARVLLVDDDTDSLEVARDILAAAGHTVVTADTLAVSSRPGNGFRRHRRVTPTKSWPIRHLPHGSAG